MPTTASVQSSVDAPTRDPLTSVVMLLAFTDPGSALRLPTPPPADFVGALGAWLAARRGSLVAEGDQLACFLGSARDAVQMAIDLLDADTTLPATETAASALRAVVMPVADQSGTARTLACRRASVLLAMSRDASLLIGGKLELQLDRPLVQCLRPAVSAQQLASHADLADVLELDWRTVLAQRPEVTQVPTTHAPPASPVLLELVHGDHEHQLSATDCPVTLGRDKSCALYLHGDVASRLHGHIAYDRGQFYFVDESRNGTYLLTPQGEEIYLHRERLPLLGRGVISPGAPIVKQTGEVLRYRCRSMEESSTLIGNFVPTPARLLQRPAGSQ